MNAPRTKLDAKSIGMVSHNGRFEKSLRALANSPDKPGGPLTGKRGADIGVFTRDLEGISPSGLIFTILDFNWNCGTLLARVITFEKGILETSLAVDLAPRSR
jgi:hypothetical protein